MRKIATGSGFGNAGGTPLPIFKASPPPPPISLYDLLLLIRGVCSGYAKCLSQQSLWVRPPLWCLDFKATFSAQL